CCSNVSVAPALSVACTSGACCFNQDSRRCQMRSMMLHSPSPPIPSRLPLTPAAGSSQNFNLDGCQFLDHGGFGHPFFDHLPLDTRPGFRWGIPASFTDNVFPGCMVLRPIEGCVGEALQEDARSFDVRVAKKQAWSLLEHL